MLEKKPKKRQEAQPLAAVDASSASSSCSSSPTIIEENAPKVKAAKATSERSTKKEHKNKGGLTMSSKVADLNLKFYEEQIEGTLEDFKARVEAVPRDEYWVLAIVHDRDQVADEIFVESFKKLHIHTLTLKRGKDKDGRAERRKVSTFLNLLGVNFREGVDDAIWENRGVERIKNLGAAVAYLTHETPEAEASGKEIYDRCEIFSNLTPEEIDQLREGYVSISHSKHKVNIDEQIALADDAFKVGYTGAKSWDEFEASLPFVLQKG